MIVCSDNVQIKFRKKRNTSLEIIAVIKRGSWSKKNNRSHTEISCHWKEIIVKNLISGRKIPVTKAKFQEQ